VTFESLTQTLRMFDSDDVRNWQILGQDVNLLVSDIIAVLLNQEFATDGPPLYVSNELTSMLMAYSKLFCRSLKQEHLDEMLEVDDKTIVDHLYDQVQFIWSN